MIWTVAAWCFGHTLQLAVSHAFRDAGSGEPDATLIAQVGSKRRGERKGGGEGKEGKEGEGGRRSAGKRRQRRN